MGQAGEAGDEGRPHAEQHVIGPGLPDAPQGQPGQIGHLGSDQGAGLKRGHGMFVRVHHAGLFMSLLPPDAATL